MNCQGQLFLAAVGTFEVGKPHKNTMLMFGLCFSSFVGDAWQIGVLNKTIVEKENFCNAGVGLTDVS